MRAAWRWVVVAGAFAPALGACRGSELPALEAVTVTDRVPVDASVPGPAASMSGPDAAAPGADASMPERDGGLAPGFPGGLCETPAPFRLLSPLSGSTVTSARPSLRVAHGNAADVQICRDRGCTLVVWQATVMGVPHDQRAA